MDGANPLQRFLLITLPLLGDTLLSGLRRLERPRRRASLASAVILTLIIFVAVIAAFPLVWMVLTSLKTPQETMRIPPVWFAAAPSLDAYWKVADVLSLGRSFLNSAVIAFVTRPFRPAGDRRADSVRVRLPLE